MAVTALIVDDSDSFRILLRTRLERIACKVVGEAADSKTGLRLFRQLKPQVVTLDLIMPDAPDFGATDTSSKNQRGVTAHCCHRPERLIPARKRFRFSRAGSYRLHGEVIRQFQPGFTAS